MTRNARFDMAEHLLHLAYESQSPLMMASSSRLVGSPDQPNCHSLAVTLKLPVVFIRVYTLHACKQLDT